MSMGGGGGTTTGSTTTKPWEPAGRNLELGLKDTRNLYNSGDLIADYYPKSTYIGPNQDELQGAARIEQLARQGDPMLGGILSQSREMIGQNGITDQQQRWLQPLTSIAAGNNEVETGGAYGGLLRNFGAPTAATSYGQRIAAGHGDVDTNNLERALAQARGTTASTAFGSRIASGDQRIHAANLGNLFSQMDAPTASSRVGRDVMSGRNEIETGNQYQDAINASKARTWAGTELDRYASGNMIGRSNPHLMGNLNRAADEAQEGMDRMFSAGGRYGSASHQGTVGETRGNVFREGLTAQMNQDIQNQFSAVGQIDATKQAQMSQRMQALSGLTGTQSANIANQLGAAAQVDANRWAQTGAQAGVAGQLADIEGRNIANRLGAAGQMDANRWAQNNQQLNAAGQIAGVEAGNVATRLGAAGQMDQSRWAQANAQMNALQGKTGVEATNIANQAAAANSMQNVFAQGNQTALNWAQMAPELRNQQFADAERLIGVGAAQRGEAQSQLQANMDKYYYNQNKDLEAIKALQGLSGPGGYGTTSQSVPRGSSFAGLLGGAMGGAQLGGMLGPMGTLAGGGLGGLLGLLR